MRLPLFPTLLTFSLAACAGHTVRPVDEPGTATPAAKPPVSAPAPTTPPQPPGRPQPAEPYEGYSSGTALEIRPIGQWTHTGIEERRRLVIQDANAWAQFWSELGVGERPEVDFSRELVIAVASGQQPTGGFSIAVEQVSQKQGELTIRVVETGPGRNCVTTSELTQPVEVVAVPQAEPRSWSFTEGKTAPDCR